MKKVKCDLCDHTVEAETFDEWMQKLQPHYMEAHAEFMKEKANLPQDQQQAEMQNWMKENKERFEIA